MRKLIDYRVTFEDASTIVIEMATGKTEARRQANKYLTDMCGYTGRNSGKRPLIISIEALTPWNDSDFTQVYRNDSGDEILSKESK